MTKMIEDWQKLITYMLYIRWRWFFSFFRLFQILENVYFWEIWCENTYKRFTNMYKRWNLSNSEKLKLTFILTRHKVISLHQFWLKVFFLSKMTIRAFEFVRLFFKFNQEFLKIWKTRSQNQNNFLIACKCPNKLHFKNVSAVAVQW